MSHIRIDSHVHLLDPVRHGYAWLDGHPDLNRSHLPSDITSVESTRLVVVEAGPLTSSSVDEARWASDLASGDFPEVAAIVAGAPLERGAQAQSHIEELTAIPLVRGVRRLLQDEETSFLESDELKAGLNLVSHAGLTFDACIRWRQLPALANLLEAVHDLPVVLDHLGKPPVNESIDSESGRAWIEGIRRIAALPHAFVKLSGLPAEVSRPDARRSSLKPWLSAAVDAFGLERSMIGSDWPISRGGPLSMGYDEWFTLVIDLLGLGPDESRTVTSRTAARFYRL